LISSAWTLELALPRSVGDRCHHMKPVTRTATVNKADTLMILVSRDGDPRRDGIADVTDSTTVLPL